MLFGIRPNTPDPPADQPIRAVFLGPDDVGSFPDGGEDDEGRDDDGGNGDGGDDDEGGNGDDRGAPATGKLSTFEMHSYKFFKCSKKQINGPL